MIPLAAIAPAPELAFDPFAIDALANPMAHHANLRDAGPLFWMPAIGCFGMARHTEVQAALKDWETFVSGRGVGLADFAHEAPWRPPSLLLETDPPVHDRTRGLMSRIASLGSIKAVFPHWQAKARLLVDRWIGQGPFDAVPALAEGFPLAVFPDLIGLRDEGREHLIPYATVAFNAFGPRNALFLETHAQAEEATRWVNASCQRENLKPNGWGAAVFAAADRGECTPEEAERLVRSFITAGVDTTVNGIATALHAFAEFPDQWQLLREKPTLLRKAIEESLRWGGTVQTFFRTAAREVAVGDHVIPEGGRVMLFLASANRDPRRWPDPDRFDITRQASGHVGFGFGIHQCLGQMVARYEAEAVLGALLERVSAIRAAGPAQRRLNNTLHAIGSLPIELVID